MLSGFLVRLGAALLLATAVLLVLLAALPGRSPLLATTISSAAYGAHGDLVLPTLLLFGLATGVLGLALGLGVGGLPGVACGSLVGVWAAAAVVDAFLRTGRVHTGTSYGQLHTVLAVAGIVAQMVVAVGFAVLAGRRGGASRWLSVLTALVLAGGVFVAVHPDSLAGLSERILFVLSGSWMVVSAHRAGGLPRPAGA